MSTLIYQFSPRQTRRQQELKKKEKGEEKRGVKIGKRGEKREEVEEREGLMVMPWWLRMIIQDQVKDRRGLLEE